MAGTVKDMMDTLKGPVARELMQREGRRMKGMNLRMEEDGNPSIPRGTVEGEPGTHAGRELRPDDLDPYEKSERESAGHVEMPEDKE